MVMFVDSRCSGTDRVAENCFISLRRGVKEFSVFSTSNYLCEEFRAQAAFNMTPT